MDKHAEQEAPVELVRLLRDGVLQFGDAPVDLLTQSRLAVRVRPAFAQVFQHGQLLAARAVGVVARQLRRRTNRSRERREAKITPVSSRKASGKPQRSGSCVPLLVVL